jgi:NitT/TauT family transport system permease protein
VGAEADIYRPYPLMVAVAPPIPPSFRWLRSLGGFLIILLVLAGLWEGYKLLGGTGLPLPVRADDRSMPHLWDIVRSTFAPARRGSEETLGWVLAKASFVTLREAVVGFLAGSLIGLSLGLLFVRSPLAERGLMPWVIASQTVPLLAIAPMVVLWAGKYRLPLWIPIAALAAFLSFFPVTVNTIRGLRSPSPSAAELFRSYAATSTQEFRKLRIPAALPYLFTALKVAAAASVVGTIVGELPSGLPDGLGRQLLTFSYYYSSGPEKLYAAVLFAVLLGLTFVAIVALVERLVIPPARRVNT